jgi:hypothetical protein
MDVSLLSSCSHVTIKTRKVDPHAEGGTGILIKENSIKAIEKCRDELSLEKSLTDSSMEPVSFPQCHKSSNCLLNFLQLHFTSLFLSHVHLVLYSRITVSIHVTESGL